ncbi:MAG: hypothetical protein LC122_05150 [Chitinophagales bacterium]|nr:hypothetical protein [Chitinophagales bacterium]
MKKLFLMAALSLAVCSMVNAQKLGYSTIIQSKDTATNADTVVINLFDAGSHLKSVQITVIKVSGTVAGKVYLQGSNNNVNWITLDSLTNSDQLYNTKAFIFSNTSYNSYRFLYNSTGTQRSVLQVAYVNRKDE